MMAKLSDGGAPSAADTSTIGRSPSAIGEAGLAERAPCAASESKAAWNCGIHVAAGAKLAAELRGDGVIDASLSMLEETGCDSVRTFCPVGKWHPAWMSKLHGDKVEPLEAGSIHRRQDLTPLYLHDGAAVAVSRSSMLLGRSSPNDPHAFFGRDRRGIQTGVGETIEIDHLRDLFWAEAVLRERQAARRRMAS